MNYPKAKEKTSVSRGQNAYGSPSVNELEPCPYGTKSLVAAQWGGNRVGLLYLSKLEPS